MLKDFRGKTKAQKFVISDLPCVCSHDKVNFVLGGVDLFEQALQINAATGAGCTDYDFHK
jgi:hypothetical protein